MKITRQRLAEIVSEEIRRCLAEADEDESSGKKSKKPETKAADEDPTRPQKPAGGAEKLKPAGGPDATLDIDDLDDQPQDEEEPDGRTEDEEDLEADAIDKDGNSGERPSGAVNDELSGKTIQAISIEPKSKILPGSKEILLSFNETTDMLRIIVTSTGQAKFFWRGQLHDLP